MNVRSQDSASRGDLDFQVGSNAHRTSNIVADSALQELRPVGRERLVVVEDDPVTRTMLVGYFSENNFDVVGAGSCAECRQALRGRADLVFLDVAKFLTYYCGYTPTFPSRTRASCLDRKSVV